MQYVTIMVPLAVVNQPIQQQNETLVLQTTNVSRELNAEDVNVTVPQSYENSEPPLTTMQEINYLSVDGEDGAFDLEETLSNPEAHASGLEEHVPDLEERAAALKECVTSTAENASAMGEKSGCKEPVICKNCGRKYSNKSNFKRHLDRCEEYKTIPKHSPLKKNPSEIPKSAIKYQNRPKPTVINKLQGEHEEPLNWIPVRTMTSRRPINVKTVKYFVVKKKTPS